MLKVSVCCIVFVRTESLHSECFLSDHQVNYLNIVVVLTAYQDLIGQSLVPSFFYGI